ncbi:MAG: 16S rRNA processing protein RimM [Paludibacteraceae bacterium]|nr:16S rRNA processing protein RimM [Paludibacteraceae bacterium]MBN2787273.1 16S rRNA processing protein RimM [Paludibacteraceae bacterium]
MNKVSLMSNCRYKPSTIMITKNEVVEVGKTVKPHGVKGEISFIFSRNNFDEENMPYFIFEIEGLLVPFFIENFRYKTTSSALVKLEGINSDEQARELCNKTIYIHQQFALKETEQELEINYFVGFEVQEQKLGSLGKIIEVDTGTENTLFILDFDGKELLIPATDDFISSIDEKNQIIHMILPKGLVNLDLAEEE